MWYNQAQLSRGFIIEFPDGTKITALDADKSPVNGWEWLTEVPQWYKDAYPEQFPQP